MPADDTYESDLLRRIDEARREGARLMAQAEGMEIALKLYRAKNGLAVTPDEAPAGGPVPPEGWKGLTRDIVDQSRKPLTSTEVLRIMALRGYGHANPKTITSTLSNLAREGAIHSDSGRYSPIAGAAQETEAAGADQSKPAALSSHHNQGDADATALAELMN